MWSGMIHEPPRGEGSSGRAKPRTECTIANPLTGRAVRLRTNTRVVAKKQKVGRAGSCKQIGAPVARLLGAGERPRRRMGPQRSWAGSRPKFSRHADFL